MTLTVRYPKIDYAKVPAHWARNIAFAQEIGRASCRERV